MTLRLRPEITRLIDDQVKRGNFATPEEVVEAAIVEMCHPVGGESDAEIQTLIDDARAELDRGEGIPFEQVEASWRKRLRGG